MTQEPDKRKTEVIALSLDQLIDIMINVTKGDQIKIQCFSDCCKGAYTIQTYMDVDKGKRVDDPYQMIWLFECQTCTKYLDNLPPRRQAQVLATGFSPVRAYGVLKEPKPEQPEGKYF